MEKIINLTWYLDRLRKMGLPEVLKRFREHLGIYCSRIKYRNPAQWPYSRFSDDNTTLALHSLPGIATTNDWRHYWTYNAEFDLTKPLDWYFSDDGGSRWPACHYARIDYRPGNPFGDVRINWELNRLQFLPAMAVTDENLAKSILKDWLEKNPYLHGPGYLASMEVALRWFSIYWAVCLFKKQIDTSFLRALTGLAVASGKFIEGRLSTHSSAGNHLIIEAVGLYWLGKALENNQHGVQWISKAREILWEQTIRQINPDGSNQEQSFWYHGFVLDALLHYLLLEERAMIPGEVWERIEKMLEFVNEMTLPDGSFPDYGDRDDGLIFRIRGDYDESPFPGLLNIGAFIFNRPEWYKKTQQSADRLAFWTNRDEQDLKSAEDSKYQPEFTRQPEIKRYKDGGMTLMKWDKGRLLFRHAPLGFGNTCGHGHADALSILFSWQNVPVLIDLGSGQYNGDQSIRDFFRSTIAHNTVEIGGKSQARMLGPFMWQQSYEATLKEAGESPILHAKANHDGYLKGFSVIHTRRIEWPSYHQIDILDSFHGGKELPLRGAFHLGKCRSVNRKGQIIEVDFGEFLFSLCFPLEFFLETYYGSEVPFMGWGSTIYGELEPIHSVVFFAEVQKDLHYRIILKIAEKNNNFYEMPH
jgi:Heparinase II/III-like protein/Heparinase II/III N-terminus